MKPAIFQPPARGPRLLSFRDSYARPRGKATPLHPVGLADGSVISIPEGWRITTSSRGAVDVAGPSGEGSANSLGDAIDFYNKRFNIGFTDQEKNDLIAFLSTL
jgi:hypothetical protein